MRQSVLVLATATLVLAALELSQLITREVNALENGLARTPPMGWMAWERFTCDLDCKLYPGECINSALFMRMADHLFADGWLAAGYSYVSIDDCWSEKARDSATEKLLPDSERFRGVNGISELAAYVHKYDSLKLGIYGDCGERTCAGYPGQLRGPAGYNNNLTRSTTTTRVNYEAPDFVSRGSYMELDAQTFASWQVDALKFDGCHVDPYSSDRVCSRMASALERTKRPILLLCEWPFYMMYAHTEPDWELTAASCNAWRYYDDIEDSWLSILNTIDHTIKHQSTMVKYHGPGHWFDPDQLVIGNFGLSVAQARAQMALWCIWSAPLYMSNDLGSIRREFVDILQNRNLIGINQDKLGVLGLMTRQSDDGLLQAFVKPIEPISQRTGCPSFAIVYLNRKTLGNHQKVSFKLADLLLGAPIRQAAKNQASVWEFEVTRGPYAGTRALRSPSEELEQLLGVAGNGKQQQVDESHQVGETTRPDAIRVSECLKRLQAAGEFSAASEKDLAKTSSAKSNKSKAQVLEFDVYDLMPTDDVPAPNRLAEPKHLGTLGAHQNLVLLVSPSSVRAIKLIEK